MQANRKISERSTQNKNSGDQLGVMRHPTLRFPSPRVGQVTENALSARFPSRTKATRRSFSEGGSKPFEDFTPKDALRSLGEGGLFGL